MDIISKRRWCALENCRIVQSVHSDQSFNPVDSFLPKVQLDLEQGFWRASYSNIPGLPIGLVCWMSTVLTLSSLFKDQWLDLVHNPTQQRSAPKSAALKDRR